MMGEQGFSPLQKEETKKEFGEFLKSLREKRGLKPKELASEAEIKPNTYSRYEQGRNRPSSYWIIQRISDALGLERFSEERARLFWLAGEWIERATPSEGLPGPRCNHLWGRTELISEVVGTLLDPQGLHIVLLSAFGGYGKTELARYVSVDLVEKNEFKDAAWLSLKQEEYEFSLGEVQPILNPISPSISSVFQGLMYRLMCQTEEQVKGRLQSEPLLIIFDNIESLPPSQREILLSSTQQLLGNGPSRAIFTSRFDLTAPYIAKPNFPGLDYFATSSLLRDEARPRLPAAAQLFNASEEQFGLIWELTKGMPLALHLVVGQSQHYELNTVIKNLREGRASGSDEALYEFLFRQGWQELGKEARSLLVYLGTVTQVPQATPQLIGLKPASDITLDERTLSESLAKLLSWKIIERVAPNHPGQMITYDLHPLTRSFVRNPDIRSGWEKEFDEEWLHKEGTRKHEELFRKWRSKQTR